MKRNIKHIEKKQGTLNVTKKQKLTKEEATKEVDATENKIFNFFDENIIQIIFFELFQNQNFKKPHKTYLKIKNTFPLVCKLFLKISKQNLFNFKYNKNQMNLNISYIPYNIYLQLKYIKLLKPKTIDHFLIQSCEIGFYNLIDILVKNKANINSAIDTGSFFNPNIKTPLMEAVLNQNIKTIKKIFEFDNLDINYQEAFTGCNALILACEKNYLDIVYLLLSRKDLNLNLQIKIGYSALMVSVLSANTNIVSLLISKKELNLNLQDTYGNTSLILASERGNTNIVKILLSRKDLNLNIQDDDGDNSLMLSSRYGYLDIVNLLILKKDLNLNLLNFYNKNALDLAKEKNRQNIVEILEKKLNSNF